MGLTIDDIERDKREARRLELEREKYIEEKNAHLEVFLNVLTTESIRHGFIIHGCGCCDSPSINKMDEEGYDYDPKGHYILESCEGDLTWKGK